MLAVVTLLYCSLMEWIRFYEYALVFASNVLAMKFPQRCNCGFRSSGMRHCIIGSLDLSGSGQCLLSNGREPVTKALRHIQRDRNTVSWSEPSLPEMLQSNTSCGASQQPHL